MDTAAGTPQAYPSTPGLYHLTTRAEGQAIYYTLRGHWAITLRSFARETRCVSRTFPCASTCRSRIFITEAKQGIQTTHGYAATRS